MYGLVLGITLYHFIHCICLYHSIPSFLPFSVPLVVLIYLYLIRERKRERGMDGCHVGTLVCVIHEKVLTPQDSNQTSRHPNNCCF